MKDNFKGMNHSWRVAGIVIGSTVSVVFWLLTIWSGIEMVKMRSFEFQGKPFWVGALLITFAAFSSSIVTWKLFVHSDARHGKANLPLWFIRLFGVFQLTLVAAYAYSQDSIFVMAAGALLSLPMILFRKGNSKLPRP